MHAHLLQTNRLVALGTLAAGVAHEINNPLTYVMGNLDYVSRMLRTHATECKGSEVVNGPTTARAFEELSVALGVARDGSERVRRIVRGLTTFGSSGSDHRSPRPARGPRARREPRVQRDPPARPARQGSARRAARGGQRGAPRPDFMNLLLNARRRSRRGARRSTRSRVATSPTRGAAPSSRCATPARASPAHPAPHLRAVLHDQGGGRGHGARPLHLPRDHHRARRRHLGAIGARRGERLPRGDPGRRARPAPVDVALLPGRGAGPAAAGPARRRRAADRRGLAAGARRLRDPRRGERAGRAQIGSWQASAST